MDIPDIDALPNNEWGKTARFGRKLTVATYADLGPGVADPAKRFAGSNMSCQSCHLEAGTKKFGLPFVGVFADFPQYRSREGEVGTLEERINGCMTRSVNGRALPIGSYEMKAFVAYIKFLSTGRPIGANQGVQFPIAQAHARIEAAALVRDKAAWLYDNDKPCGPEANTAKLLASQASWDAANAALDTHGGYGFAAEYDVERKFRETRLYQVAPISTNLIYSYVAEHLLGLPRSF